ncbi:type II toxin-antitoxin system HipA family toxin [Aliarcobacter cibarius]|uniref:HipA domain-containing protein n=1 Tax=Aliarcobacter cibarius TaxID=255507 RepID=A0A7L5JNT0_9BACT|nr:HipA domain-containing protein [Aliarcobacter cibarius]QKJ26799.1 toxin-antitoxin system, toxin component, HipA family [Aliarcobacter cibarius]TLS98063.1 HipA domain-containing protein [Aliarcobacter cibarius]TLS98983.1 HipA domain-containing protein [Aliarcobacter cibarius]
MQKISIYIFGNHIADMYQEEDKVYLKQVDDLCNKVSPLMLNSNQKEIDTTHLTHLERVAGFISDSLPGNFGNEILNNFFLQNSNKYPTVSDKLLFIGNRGLGAITYEPSMEKENEFIETIELKYMFEKAKELKKGGDYHSLQDAFVISAHSFVGGARSKAVGAINLDTKEVFLGDRTKPLKDGFFHAIIKYDDTANDDENKSTYSKVEYIYHILAKKCGIDMADCYLVQTDDKHHFVTKRFDIEPNGKRYHVHSLAGLLHLDYNIPRSIGYEDLLRTAVKLGAIGSLKQLFLQMLFNYMFVNQDDHSRNFSFMCDSDFKYKATPAYDLTFAKGEKQTVEHQLSLYGKALSKIDIDDITTLATEFSIDLEFVAASLEKMKNLRDKDLPQLLKDYEVKPSKQKQIIEHTSNRTLQGAL